VVNFGCRTRAPDLTSEKRSLAAVKCSSSTRDLPVSRQSGQAPPFGPGGERHAPSVGRVGGADPFGREPGVGLWAHEPGAQRVLWRPFHYDQTGVTGLIDWAGSRRGPILYDVASALMYLGGTEHAAAFLNHYAERGPLAVDEMRHIDAFRRSREAVQVAYFAGRLAANDLAGGIAPAENQKGLDDARRRLEALGATF